MTCNCRSYNMTDLGGTDPEVILPRPDWLPDGERINGVCIDACIAETIKLLWKVNLQTLSSCCGHNRENPSIVVPNGERLEIYHSALMEFDSRNWDVCRWELLKHTNDNKILRFKDEVWTNL